MTTGMGLVGGVLVTAMAVMMLGTMMSCAGNIVEHNLK